jgi:hypothetical protein
MENDETFESENLQFQSIKNRFESYEKRRNKVVANNYQLLRSQVESSFTPTYVDGSYVKPVAVVEQNNLPIEGKDHLWRMWFLDLDESTSTLNVSVVIDLDGTEQTVNVTNLDASVEYATFLDNFIAGFTSDDIAVTKHCDKCVVFSETDSSTEIKSIVVTVS